MYLRIPCELGLSWQTHWLPGEPIFGPFLLKGFWTNWPLCVHNCLVVNLSTNLFIYLSFIYLIIGIPFTNNFVCGENNWEDNSWYKGLRKKSNDLILCFPVLKWVPEPNPNNGTSPVNFCLTFSCACVFCFSLSLKYFDFLYVVFIVYFFAHFFLSSQPWVFVYLGNWCNQHQCKPSEANNLLWHRVSYVYRWLHFTFP